MLDGCKDGILRRHATSRLDTVYLVSPDHTQCQVFMLENKCVALAFERPISRGSWHINDVARITCMTQQTLFPQNKCWHFPLQQIIELHYQKP